MKPRGGGGTFPRKKELQQEGTNRARETRDRQTSGDWRAALLDLIDARRPASIDSIDSVDTPEPACGLSSVVSGCCASLFFKFAATRASSSRCTPLFGLNLFSLASPRKRAKASIQDPNKRADISSSSSSRSCGLLTIFRTDSADPVVSCHVGRPQQASVCAALDPSIIPALLPSRLRACASS